MQIANPIYDVVFKYMMEDNDVAKLLISKIMDEEIIKLDFLPQENVVNIDFGIPDLKKREKSKTGARYLTVYRLDFKAEIKTPAGSKIVLIEVQKAKFPTDILRFRKYLGEQYADPKNKTIPIVSIYFLAYGLEHTKSPVIKVEREYIDVTTGEKIKEKEEFIESLTHDSYVIQIKYLKKEHKSDLEKLLSVFDQADKSENAHILSISEDEYPKEFNVLLKRLQKAVLDNDLRKKMDVEDQIIEELNNLERTIEEQEEIIEKKDKVIEEKDKTIEDNKKALEEKDRLIEELMKKIK